MAPTSRTAVSALLLLASGCDQLLSGEVAAVLVVPISNGRGTPRLLVRDCVPLPGGGCAQPIDDLVVDFGTVRRGQCLSANVTVENAGTAALIVQPSLTPDPNGEMAFDGPAPA